jgi:drug/metabolite transporter (DMT)-like permease
LQKRNPTVGAVFALSGALLFGLNASTSKVLIASGVDPSVVVLFRSAATSLLAALVVVLTNPKAFKITWREVPRMLLFGVVGVALMQWAYSQAVSNMQVGVALLIEYTAIIWVPLASWLIYKEHLKPRIWVSVGLVLAGLLVVSNIWNGGLNLTGVTFAFMAAAFLTLYFIMGEHAQKTRDTFSTLAYSMLVSTMFWFIFAPWQNFDASRLAKTISLSGNLAAVNVPLWVLLIWLAVMGSFVPMALSYRALHHMSATGTGIASTAETVFAFSFGFIWLNEQISGTQIIGGLLVLIGIILAQTARQQRKN